MIFLGTLWVNLERSWFLRSIASISLNGSYVRSIHPSCPGNGQVYPVPLFHTDTYIQMKIVHWCEKQSTSDFSLQSSTETWMVISRICFKWMNATAASQKFVQLLHLALLLMCWPRPGTNWHKFSLSYKPRVNFTEFPHPQNPVSIIWLREWEQLIRNSVIVVICFCWQGLGYTCSNFISGQRINWTTKGRVAGEEVSSRLVGREFMH